MKIRVGWNNDAVTPNSFAGPMSDTTRHALVWKVVDGVHSCSESSERWNGIFTFEVPDVATALRVSGEIMHILEHEFLHPIPSVRWFEGENVKELNLLLFKADEYDKLKPVVKKVAADLKATRSYFLSPPISRRLKAIRLALETTLKGLAI